ncbi:hypothetical protein [Sporosarcina psychrophila]|uniref:Uncharacterized protein n=1 Tax=Sporosarcina psychrophila TaxID=1476 RepID=A0ABV2KHR0_SPOPS
MTELRVINGIKKEKPNYRRIYSKAFANTLKSALKETEEIKEFQFSDLSLDIRKKLVLYGVKNINATNLDILDSELLVGTFNTISMLNSMMGTFTPREFLTVFPITKEYDGERYGMKDYFYTKKAIEEFGMDKVIGEEMKRFHWDYTNRELTKFATRTMAIMSAISRSESDKGVVEEFFGKQVSITHAMTEDHQDKQLPTNNDTRKAQEVMSFRDAVHNWIIEVFDDECKEVLDDSMKGKLTSDAFDKEASAVFGTFLTELYTENREKFIELAKPIYEEYCRMKNEEDTYWKREQLKNANLSLIVNKKLTPKQQLRE